MKKALSVLLAVLLAAGCLSGCKLGRKPDSDGKLKVVATIFPEYDWVMSVIGDNPAKAEVTLLLDSGVDLHNYQPTAADILKISECDLFIYVGGESDGWVNDVLKSANNKNMVVINLLDALGDAVKEEEVVEGMQEEEHDHDHEDADHDHEDADHDHEDGDHDHDHEHGEEPEYDEHVWLSLKNAGILTGSIAEAFCKADPEHADTYKKNAEAYKGKLKTLDEQYRKAVSEANVKTVLFGDRFPFRYLTDDYNLTYYAAFVGCSAETEASFETVIFLAGKMDELSLPAVLTIEGNDHKIAETIVRNTGAKNQKILTMDSMQSTTTKDIKNGTTYLSVMEQNLTVLKEALN